MPDISSAIAALSPEKRALLAKKLKENSHQFNVFPLSFAQQRLWFLDQFEPGSPVYNIPAAVQITGDLHLAALKQSLEAVLERHEILRTTFTTIEGKPVQVISEQGALSLATVDLSGLPQDDRQAEVRRLAVEESLKPFDLRRGPLLRLALYRLDECEHVLLLVMHHIVSDGWSTNILIKEIAALYQAFLHGKPSPLPELPIQYADFAKWQRQWLQKDRLEALVDYWRKELEGSPPVLELPTDRPRPAHLSHRGSSRSAVLPKELVDSIKTLSQAEGVTQFMLLLAAWQTLLYRASGQTDICVGTPVANRNRAEIEGLVGFFVNTLVLRAQIDGDQSFRQLLEQVRERALGAYAHQDLPFELMVEALQPERDMSHTPFFQVMFTHQNAPKEWLEIPGLMLQSISFEHHTAKFDLLLSTRETEEGMLALLEYNTDLFDASTIDRMLGHYKTLLESITSNPDETVAKLQLLTQAEIQQLLEWNDTATAYPKNACVHELFEEQALREPNRIAVVFRNRQLTYRELNEKANQVAHYLQELGVGPDDFVGICMERSIEMVVGILGILKAGGAYVPLDPAYPKERLAFMLADTRTPVVLIQERLADRLPDHQAKVICLDRDWGTIEMQSGAQGTRNPVSGAAAENLAYVMYTSGSTGKPKGISIPHRAINRLVFKTNYIQMEPSDRVALVSNSAFDAATFELWGALLHGARLIGVSKETVLSPHEFVAMIRESGITTMFLTTALFNQIVREVPDAFRTLHHLMIGGEAVDPQRVREALEKGPPQRFLHVYGPTESTTFATWYLTREVPQGASTIPIGRPLSNTQTYVLDRNLQPVPPGVPGELFIGGDGLARDYLNRPDLTAEKFIPNPFVPTHTYPHSSGNSEVEALGQAGGERLYRTGDLVRLQPDGEIEFLGRIDHQVKLRGFRIELAEIEAVLDQHPSIKDAVVLVREDAPGDKRLVAFVVSKEAGIWSRDGNSPEVVLCPPSFAGEIRSYLRERLPDYMVPAAFISLEELPINPNGKVDRKALAALAALPVSDAAHPETGDDSVAPRTPVEEVLAGIWSEVLHLEPVSAMANFYDLGGHSLLATQVISRVRDVFQVEIPLRDLFEAPSIAGLAERVEKALKADQKLAAPPIHPVPREQALPLSFAQQRLWFMDQIDPGNPAYNMSIAVRLTGDLDVIALERSLNEIVRRHESLRTTFASPDGLPVQVIGPVRSLEIPVEDISAYPKSQQETHVRKIAAEESLLPFDLAAGPLFRVRLIKLGPDEHVALFTTHHIVSDEWSLGVLVRELGALYQAFCHGKPTPLPELEIQYADFASWQRQWLQGEALEEQLAYWRRQLSGNLPSLDLPYDHPRPRKPTYRGALQPFALSPEVSHALKTLSRQEGATLFMTLLAGLQILLQRHTGQDDILVGTDVANRNHLKTEDLIGFFVNHLILRTNLSDRPTFRQLLRRVREITLEAYAHQDLPFDRLVSALQLERNLSQAPLFQVLFVFGNPTMPRLELPGLRLEPLKADAVLAKYDLTLFVNEREGSLAGAWRYSPELFDATTISRLSAHLETLLESAAASPDARINRLEMLSDAEKQQESLEKEERQKTRASERRGARRKTIELNSNQGQSGQ